MPKELTATAVAKLKPKRERYEKRDASLGLSVCVQSTGVKSWTMRFRRPDGRSAKFTLGPVDLSGRKPKADDELQIGAPLTLVEARVLASEVNRRRTAGRDVVAEHFVEKQRRREAAVEQHVNTFAAAARAFIDEHARPKTRRWRETARLLGLSYPLDGGKPTEIKGGLAARWSDKQIADIDGHDVHAIVREATKHGIPGIRARNGGASDPRGRALFRALSKMFSWSGRRGHKNPCAGEECPGAPPARDRKLEEKEIRWLWLATEAIGEPFGPLVRLLLLTGARREEIAQMLWSEISDDGKFLNLPGSRTKNGKPHEVPLPSAAQEILANVKRIAGRPGYCFTTNGRTPVSGFSKIKARLDARMLAEANKERGSDTAIAPWRLHDVRRTAASGMQRLGVPVEVIERCLNHLSGSYQGVAGIYQRDPMTDAVRDALERWATHVLAIVAGPKVIPLRGRVS
jgi:integrase